MRITSDAKKISALFVFIILGLFSLSCDMTTNEGEKGADDPQTESPSGNPDNLDNPDNPNDENKEIVATT